MLRTQSCVKVDLFGRKATLNKRRMLHATENVYDRQMDLADWFLIAAAQSKRKVT